MISYLISFVSSSRFRVSKITNRSLNPVRSFLFMSMLWDFCCGGSPGTFVTSLVSAVRRGPGEGGLVSDGGCPGRFGGGDRGQRGGRDVAVRGKRASYRRDRRSKPEMSYSSHQCSIHPHSSSEYTSPSALNCLSPVDDKNMEGLA